MNSCPELPHILTVRSSAGAGKTYNLALRYLRLLVLNIISGKGPENRVPNIVAITFTNKAAAEMRLRILDWMKRIILDLPFEGLDDRPIDEILERGGSRGQGVKGSSETLEPSNPRTLEPLIRHKISQDFEGMLKNFSDFKVSTIDSFVNLTLKASAFKLNLPPDFEISTDSSTYLDFVLQECLQQILEDEQVREKFDRFLRSYIETEGENVAWLPRIFLREAVTLLWTEEAKENLQLALPRNPGETERLAQELKNLAQGLSLRLTMQPGIKAHKRFLDALGQLSGSLRPDPLKSTYFRKASLQECLLKGSLSDSAAEDLWARVQEQMGRYVEALSESKFAPYIEVYSLFKETLEREITYRKRVVLIEQLNARLQAIINDEAFIPEVYYALAERYGHFLIDEFQDTNQLQWKNIEVLADEALSRGGTLFLVGDKKQAIYRFRGGKPELVDEVALQYSGYPVYALELARNYRSCEGIVNFNNVVFSGPNLERLVRAVTGDPDTAELQGLVDGYRCAPQEVPDSKLNAGYVRIEKLSATDEEEAGASDDLSKDERYEMVKTRVRGLIHRIRARGVFRDDEIALLVRRREEADLMVKVLLEVGLAVDSEHTVDVRNNSRINEVMSLLRFLDSPEDDLSFAAFVTGGIFLARAGLKSEEIQEWVLKGRLEGRGEHLYRLFQRQYPKIWEERFEHPFRSAGYLPLYEIILLLLRKWDVLAAFPEDAPYVLHLCELVKERELTGANNLPAFLRFWEGDNAQPGSPSEKDPSFSLKTVEGANAIKVLTIHKAKGLQFPVVVLPFLKLNSFGASDSRDKSRFFVRQGDLLRLLYIKKDFTDFSDFLGRQYRAREADFLLDELNSTYVACTRAEKELYVLLTESKRQKNYLIDYLFAMEDLAAKVEGDVLAIGSETGPRDEAGGGAGPGTPTRPGIGSPFGDQDWDLHWMERIRTKVEEVSGISRERRDAKKKGDVIHYMLSLVERLSEPLEEYVDRLVKAGTARFPNQADPDEMRKRLLRIFRNPSFSDFFRVGDGATVFTEKEVVDSRGNAYKVDRLVINETYIDVIDFKTGEARMAEHRTQVRAYGDLLGSIYPEKELRTYLLYLDEGAVARL